MNKTACEKFNAPRNILIISNYPTFVSNKMQNIMGVSTYTYNLLTELKQKAKDQNRQIVVLADIVGNSKPEIYEEDGVLIDRCWKKNSLNIFGSIFRAVKRYNRASKIFIHFEFNMYGSGFITYLFTFFLKKLHKNKKSVTLLIHQVVDNLSSLGGHLGLSTGSIKLRVLDYFMRRFLYGLLGEAQKIVVHDSILGNRLNKIRKAPIYVIPHGMVDHAEQCELKNFRKDIGLGKKDFIVLTFGFLTWYKGSDWLVDKFKQYYDKTKDESIKLVLAGGKSANLQGQKFYEDYYSSVVKDLNKYPNIIHTGYVSNEDIHKYYCSSDVVVFPYRTHMSASGPMSFAMSFDRPFLISDSMASILNTTDVKDSMEKLKLENNDIVFKMGNSGSLFEKISELISNKKLLNSLSALSEEIKDKRIWSKTADKFLSLIDA